MVHESFTETTMTGWFSGIGGAFKGMIFWGDRDFGFDLSALGE